MTRIDFQDISEDKFMYFEAARSEHHINLKFGELDYYEVVLGVAEEQCADLLEGFQDLLNAKPDQNLNQAAGNNNSKSLIFEDQNGNGKAFIGIRIVNKRFCLGFSHMKTDIEGCFLPEMAEKIYSSIKNCLDSD